MERNQAVSVAIGVGAVSTILGYLGYSYMQNRQSELVEVENTGDESQETPVDKPKSTFWVHSGRISLQK